MKKEETYRAIIHQHVMTALQTFTASLLEEIAVQVEAGKKEIKTAEEIKTLDKVGIVQETYKMGFNTSKDESAALIRSYKEI